MKDFEAIGETLAAELEAAFVPFLTARLAERGLPNLDENVVHAALGDLHDLLAELRAPAADQRRGPLELFQAALGGPNQALEDMGVEPPPRDPVTANALPGDHYALAPASSSELGEQVWRAHIAWGIAKAAELKKG